MNIKVFQIDAFSDECFRGNPAAICPLDEWISDDLMQKIACENNLSETAYFKKEGDKYKLRWFTPEREIELCGHATLASAYVIFEYLNKEVKEVTFATMSGDLVVNKEEEKISMMLPKIECERVEVTESLIEALGVIPREVLKGNNLMVVLEDEDDVKYLKPNMEILKNIGVDGIIVTAKGREVDFVSRFFVPNSVIKEDPVTGSAHCELAPYWSRRLRKTILNAEQLSKRGGKLLCEVLDNAIKISGNAVIFLEGTIKI